MLEDRKITILDNGNLEIFIPARIKRLGHRRTIVIPDASSDNASKPLAVYLARAHAWRKALVAGNYRDILKFSKSLKLDPSYVGRIFRLVNLAPDIQEAILNGTEPDGLTLSKLRSHIPDDWQEQRKRLGF